MNKAEYWLGVVVIILSVCVIVFISTMFIIYDKNVSEDYFNALTIEKTVLQEIIVEMNDKYKCTDDSMKCLDEMSIMDVYTYLSLIAQHNIVRRQLVILEREEICLLNK